VSADLAVLAQDPTALDRAADPGEFVVLACERAKQWLTEALAHGEITQIVEIKSQAEAIRVYTAQKQIGKDAELAAAEVVRRAERGIGVAIRKGQGAGEIRKHGDPTSPPAEAYLRERNGRVEVVEPHAGSANPRLPGPSEVTGMPRDELTRGPYALADDVTDEQFDVAVGEAKAEGNLSRANVVRKVKGESPKPSVRPDHLRGLRHHDPNRIVQEITTGLEGYVLAVDLIDFDRLDRTQIAAWSGSLTASLQSLNRLSRRLKELDQA
jgi:hypothetical protein